MFSLLFSLALANEPLVIQVEDPQVETVELRCSNGKTHTSAVRGGSARFLEDPGACQVVFIRPAGRISGQGRFTCGLTGCRQDDVFNRAIPDAPGVINVVFTDTLSSGSVEIRCPSGYRQRDNIVDNTAILQSVPDEPCTAALKGAMPATYNGIRHGTWYCSVANAIMNCKQQ